MTGFGVSFLLLGVLLLFDRGLLAVGNIFFLAGLSLIIGYKRIFGFFFQKDKLHGSAFFFLGVLVVLLGYPLIGMLIETYGFVKIFGGFLPTIIGFLRQIPFVGPILNFL